MITERSNHIIPWLKRLRRRSSSLWRGFKSDRLRWDTVGEFPKRLN
ncbi:hypothetical protein H6G91_10500 [Nostoc muscorum FACHB-395]|nr:hypothetical protein [Desmonostoc muscorum FACHB-395]